MTPAATAHLSVLTHGSGKGVLHICRPRKPSKHAKIDSAGPKGSTEWFGVSGFKFQVRLFRNRE